MNKYNSILLVDDDQDSCFLNKRCIEGMNIADRIYVLNNGKEALDFILNKADVNNALRHIEPEIIFLDISMPVMDGFQFLEELQQHNPLLKEKLKIFILTSSMNERDIQKAREYKVSGYIQKPISKAKITQSIL